MKFIHITDPHLTAPGERLFGFDPHKRLDTCLKDIQRLHPDAAFCVVTGDLAEEGDLPAYRALAERLARFPLPVRLILGNCDDRENFRAVFGGEDASGFVQWAEKRDEGTFLFLDTLADDASAEGRYDEARQAWLASQLAKAGGDVFLFMHHPPFDIGHINDAIKLREAAEFQHIVAGHRVRHIFFGHTHRPVSGQWKGIGFSCLPGLGFQIPLVPSAVETRMSDEPPMYGVVTIDAKRVIVHFDAFAARKGLRGS